jgi:hypothetical protein
MPLTLLGFTLQRFSLLISRGCLSAPLPLVAFSVDGSHLLVRCLSFYSLSLPCQGIPSEEGASQDRLRGLQRGLQEK